MFCFIVVIKLLIFCYIFWKLEKNSIEFYHIIIKYVWLKNNRKFNLLGSVGGDVTTFYSWENVLNIFLSFSHIPQISKNWSVVQISPYFNFFQLDHCFHIYPGISDISMAFMLDMLFCNNIQILLLFWHSCRYYFQCSFSYFSCIAFSFLTTYFWFLFWVTD